MSRENHGGPAPGKTSSSVALPSDWITVSTVHCGCPADLTCQQKHFLEVTQYRFHLARRAKESAQTRRSVPTRMIRTALVGGCAKDVRSRQWRSGQESKTTITERMTEGCKAKLSARQVPVPWPSQLQNATPVSGQQACLVCGWFTETSNSERKAIAKPRATHLVQQSC